MSDDYQKKYLKYKERYLILKRLENSGFLRGEFSKSKSIRFNPKTISLWRDRARRKSRLRREVRFAPGDKSERDKEIELLRKFSIKHLNPIRKKVFKNSDLLHPHYSKIIHDDVKTKTMRFQHNDGSVYEVKVENVAMYDLNKKILYWIWARQNLSPADKKKWDKVWMKMRKIPALIIVGLHGFSLNFENVDKENVQSAMDNIMLTFAYVMKGKAFVYLTYKEQMLCFIATSFKKIK